MSHEIDECYAVYCRTRRKARLAHVCCACAEAISPGHQYIYVATVFEGCARSYKRCLRCEAIFDELVKRLRDSDQWPDERLNCGHEWSENFDGPPPDEIARLAFLTPAEIQAELGKTTQPEAL